MNDFFIKLSVPNEQSMLALGKQLALACGETAVLFLQGDLGAGKTTLTRGFMRGLGYNGHVKSPTYTLVEPYQLTANTVYHFDFYRLRDSSELEYMGIQDYFVPRAICIIEWPEYGEDRLPSPDVSCEIKQVPHGREVILYARSESGNHILHRFEYDE
jgi:tRNA threonylcarbamoyladenosine biosynthesis protein TsaE